jgi:hypothetical protein|tara:strand:+ start:467 stop:958 length:492 start_codon:yes stop_codon:yes gene_type:complete
MNFREIVSRLTGLSSPVFGVSWNPPEPQVKIARRIVAFLEDRRVLFEPSEMEIPSHCIQSILDIRRYLTTELQSLDSDTEIANSLRALRAACRKFMKTVGARSEIIDFGASHGHWASWKFMGALGELRGVFGVHIARLAASYGLDVEDDLAKILPADPNEGNR